VRPDRRPLDGKYMTVRLRTFRKHRRPCGQPAVVGEIGRFRPVPPQAGHCVRINATPSDLPFRSTGLATYPVPPQVGQSSGSTPLSPSLLRGIVHDEEGKIAGLRIVLRNPNKPAGKFKRPLFCGMSCGQAPAHRRSLRAPVSSQ
jgi:hypothetical protein